jgi:hypothetical protein
VTSAHDDPTRRVPQQILSEVERRRTAQIIGLVVVVFSAMLALAARLSHDSLMGLPFVFWGVLAVILLLAKIAFFILAWRCPSCGGSLGSTYTPRFCSSCGIRLKRDDQEGGAP